MNSYILRIAFISLFFVFFLNNKLYSKSPRDTISLKDSTYLLYVTDDPILQMLDSLWASDRIKRLIKPNYILPKKEIYKIPTFSDSILSARMKELKQKSPLPLAYNQYVKSYINVYTVQKREKAQQIMGLADLYFPLFEEILDKHGLPLELKYLAIIESALNPNARSRVGATGLWQFMYGTGKWLKINITSYVDDRRDPIKSTEAACKYLQYLHGMFHDWNLVLAAYNAGPGNVNKAIRRSGGKKSFWAIYQFLPAETRSYVPAFNAAVYFMNYSKEHNMHPIKAPYNAFEVDTVCVKHDVNFEQISNVLGITVEALQYLNPAYTKNIIIADSKNNILTLPTKYIGEFINNEIAIYQLKEEQTGELVQANEEIPEPVVVNEPITHIVKRGDYLGQIANKYNVSVTDIKNWNNLRSSSLAVGQRLKIKKNNSNYTESSCNNNKDNNSNHEKPNKTEEFTYYTVKHGDTLWSISKKFNNISVNDIKSLNNLNTNVVKPGMKLKIYKSA